MVDGTVAAVGIEAEAEPAAAAAAAAPSLALVASSCASFFLFLFEGLFSCGILLPRRIRCRTGRKPLADSSDWNTNR